MFAMDQLSAHLDRGWDLIQKGDVRGAEVSARQALEIDGQCPEAYNLLGFVASMDGDGYEAVEQFCQAVALDDTYLEAMLNAAEHYIYPLGQYDEALKICEQALGVGETLEERVDVLLTMVEAHLGRGDRARARSVAMLIPNTQFEDPMYYLLVGSCLVEVGEHERAEPLMMRAAATPELQCDAWYGVGLIRDERGDERGATEAYLVALGYASKEPRQPWSLTQEQFAEQVQGALAQMDPELGQYVNSAQVCVAQLPGVELVADGVDPRTLCLFDGLSSQDRPEPPCKRVFVYQCNIEAAAGSPDELQRVIVQALESEVQEMFLQPQNGEQGSLARDAQV